MPRSSKMGTHQHKEKITQNDSFPKMKANANILVRDGAQWWNGNLSNSHRSSLEMRLLVAQSTQP